MGGGWRESRQRERGKKENGKCKCIDTCENCKFGVGINNGTVERTSERVSERVSEARRTTSKIIENRAAGAGLRNPEENKNSGNEKTYREQYPEVGWSCK